MLRSSVAPTSPRHGACSYWVQPALGCIIWCALSWLRFGYWVVDRGVASEGGGAVSSSRTP